MELRDGITLLLHEDEDLSNHIRKTGDFFESHILDYIREFYPEHGSIVDVGANIGNHMVYFAKYLKYRALFGFEPVPENYLILVDNMLTVGAVNYGLAQFAISDHTGKLKFRVNKRNMGASQVDPNGDLVVSCYPLDHWYMTDVTLLKIDAEWHEPQVLEGAKDTIFRCKPLILIEDSNREYSKLLPDYKLVKEWPEDKTYLYRWADDRIYEKKGRK